MIFDVAPFAGAWIEINSTDGILGDINVAPFAGAWIEILCGSDYTSVIGRRSLRGSVD